jgi:hypothetical protein
MTAEEVCTGVVVKMAEVAFSNDHLTFLRKERSHENAAATSNSYCRKLSILLYQ